MESMSAWDRTIVVHAHLGFADEAQKCYEVYAPTAMAVAVTSHICALSLRHPPGTKFVIGPLWVERIKQNAAVIDAQDTGGEM